MACCTVWSNFEIADMDFWRGEAYMKFFEHLDLKGGFYYEVRRSSRARRPYQPLTFSLSLSLSQPRFRPQRWGDAPVHSIAAGLLQSKDKLHFFDDIGYEHSPFTHCPHGDGAWARGRCGCNPEKSFGTSRCHRLYTV